MVGHGVFDECFDWCYFCLVECDRRGCPISVMSLCSVLRYFGWSEVRLLGLTLGDDNRDG